MTSWIKTAEQDAWHCNLFQISEVLHVAVSERYWKIEEQNDLRWHAANHTSCWTASSLKNQRSFTHLHSMDFQTGCACGFFQQAGRCEIPFEKVKQDGDWM